MCPSDHRLEGDMMTYRGRCHSQVKRRKTDTTCVCCGQVCISIQQPASFLLMNILQTNMLPLGDTTMS